MAYLKYYDNRFGDLYEIYYNDDGEFEGAMRSFGMIGQDSIYYDKLTDIPPFHQNQIEHLIWKATHKSSPKGE